MIRFSIVLLGSLLLSSSLLAQVGQTTYQDELLVTATLAATEESEQPVTVHRIDRQQIDERLVDSVEDLLLELPGVHTVTLGSPGQQTSLFVRGAESDQALVLWNGIPLNDPYFGGFNWAYLPTEGVDRVEVVSGPVSALYGSAAVGGVVQLITGDAPHARLDLEAGENAHRRVATSVSDRFTDWSFDLHGHWREGDGHHPNDFYDSTEVAGLVRYHPSEQTWLGARVRHNDSQTGIPFDGARASLERQIDWQETQVAVPFEATFEQWDVTGYLGQIDYDYLFTDPQDPFGFTEGRTESVSRRVRSVVTVRPNDDFWIGVGADHEELEVDDRSSYGSNLDGAEQETTGLFSQAHYSTDRASFDLGLRYDDNDVYGSETSPRVGATFLIHPELRLRASYSEGFRAPSLGELYFPFSGNPELDPERSEGWEAAVHWQRDRWSLDLVTFETRFSNLISYDFAAGGNINLGRARSRGTELQVGYRSSALELRAQWSLLDAESLETGEPLRRRPDDSGSLALTLRPGRWTINLRSIYVGPRADVDAVTFADATNPSHLRHDLALRWQLSDRLTPYLKVVNAADEEYQEALGFPAPGRTLTAGITFSR